MSVKASNRNEQKIEFSIQGKDFAFIVNRDNYNAFVNSLAAPGKKNIVQQNHNFLMQVVHQDSREALLEIIDNNPGSEMEIAGTVIEMYSPDLAIVVKKRMN